MARVETITLVDDLDGGAADETVEFTIGTTAYAIDLSTANAAALRDALAPYIGAARRSSTATVARPGRSRTAASTSTSTSTEHRQHTAAIRSWARDNGYPIAERGRIPAEIIEAYENNAGTGPTPAPRTATGSTPQFREAG